MTRETLEKANELIKKIQALYEIKRHLINGHEFTIECIEFDQGKVSVEIPSEIIEYLTIFVDETHKKLSKEFEEL